MGRTRRRRRRRTEGLRGRDMLCMIKREAGQSVRRILQAMYNACWIEMYGFGWKCTYCICFNGVLTDRRVDYNAFATVEGRTASRASCPPTPSVNPCIAPRAAAALQ